MFTPPVEYMPRAEATATANALQSSIPGPASVAPPAVGTENVKGTTTTAYALADHTHASSVQRRKFTLLNGGIVTWTFNPPYAAGQIPVVTYGIENTSGSDMPYVVNITAVSNTAASFKAYKAQPTTLGGTLSALINTVISPFIAAPAGLTIHCWAAKETV